ncbi:hypothetical protein VTO42DRAFT_6063 [Malbranchea cinnamomea]
MFAFCRRPQLTSWAKYILFHQWAHKQLTGLVQIQRVSFQFHDSGGTAYTSRHAIVNEPLSRRDTSCSFCCLVPVVVLLFSLSMPHPGFSAKTGSTWAALIPYLDTPWIGCDQFVPGQTIQIGLRSRGSCQPRVCRGSSVLPDWENAIEHGHFLVR